MKAGTYELSRPLSVETLGVEPVIRTITASPEELEALARRFSLPELKSFVATLTVHRRNHGRLISVKGELKAEPVQICVVTLEPFLNSVEDSFEITFTTDPAAAVSEVEIDPESLDEPEPLEGGTLDLGELAAQFLSLALDPHPRKPGVEFDYRGDEAEDEGTRNPFEVLKKLKSDQH
jgi:uncharacterized metal-binding protein YceD (DUF177 family)